jgi:hypothetical protein
MDWRTFDTVRVVCGLGCGIVNISNCHYNHCVYMALTLSSHIVITEFAEALIAGIAENIRSKNVTPFGSMHTTGHAEDSLFYKITDNKLIIGSSWAYITVLEDGRKPGKFAPPEVIEKWIEDKPIPVTDNSNFQGAISKESLAFLINRKLKEEGSLIYQQGGNSGILSDYLNQEYVHKFLTLPLKDAVIDEVSNILFKRSA